MPTLRDRLTAALKRAKHDGDDDRVCILRLVATAINDLELAKRGSAEVAENPVTDDEVRAILERMIRQRQDSVRAYEESGRLELAEQERAEADVIEAFLPRPMSDDEAAAAIRAAIADSRAESLRDLGKVMGLLEARHGGRMDMTSIGPEVRARLGA
ncbi:GatB/YqeY domain-containing protein [Meridianimarinicoccus sp. RP-17]|uniref:GatB/YqeY domain-containing protein n=1 Tax=Meridianimarinicoccus zhengii TaxID=2056810 RepID=UPI000DAB4B6E|nr:GatB/YqeY domain-containing protein [Phycocomes zhengii]